MTTKGRLYVGIDIGGTKISAALVSASGRILARGKVPTPQDAGAKRILKAVSSLVEDLLEAAGAARGAVSGIGDGVPGIVDSRTGNILAAPNIRLAGAPLAQKLRRRFGVRVAVGNDANLGVLGEQWLGAGKGRRDLVGLFIGTGVGGGVLLDGKLLLGAHGAAAELGHIVIDLGGERCGCGNRGCIEALASRRAVERDIRQAVKYGEKSVVTKLAGKDLKVIRSRVLRKALKKGDGLVKTVLRRSSEALGDACVALRHVFDPELFVFGGGLIEACGGFMLPIIRRRIRKDKFFKFADCDVRSSRLGDDAVILGAVALVKRP